MSTHDPDYYAELYSSADPVVRAGWRHRVEQALRFEAALDGAPEGGSILDVGCGPGGLFQYLHDTGRASSRYRGIDRMRCAIDDAHARFPSAPPTTFAHLSIEAMAQTRHPFSSALAIGAAVDGIPRRSQHLQHEHVRQLVHHMLAHAVEHICLIVLNRSVIDAHPVLRMERPVLVALHPHELHDLVVGALPPGTEHYTMLSEDMLRTDVVMHLWRGPHAAARAARCADLQKTLHTRALDGPWGASPGTYERAWLLAEAGQHEAARAALLSNPALHHDGRARQLMELLGG